MRAIHLLLALVIGLLASVTAQAEPYLAIRYGLKCSACHVNPSGGGLRTALGQTFVQNVIAANPAPAPMSSWTGSLASWLRVGGDLRTDSTETHVSGQPSTRVSGNEQTRLYADLQLLDNRLGAYIDEQVAPGKSLRQEAYLRLQTSDGSWYAKAGQFYLPFGWRLQDNTAFVRQLSGISMTVPDKGVEFGMDKGDWSAQLVYSDGPGNKGSVRGHQLTGQVMWLQSWGRLGASTAKVQSTAGGRDAWGLFAGTTTGPVAWLAELDYVSDEGFPEGRRRQTASLLEANWLVIKGHNLKLSSEWLDPDTHVSHDDKVRYSLVYEYTPIGFMQLRGGYRWYGGIPQNAVDNRRTLFAELHAFF
ncbi:hypothetical protein SNE35_30050 [Paucibacter sp. R3-3]|uniref:Cytochrome c domain-containing protein n=1 Tax=Roseateles agri TaxID=3098619 RepID=A0ABU5DRN0_9BURK|nr:hypothetical protein [Paucibacter sp. R3-3]MDY0748779.1 hypothetical protein [Paucibacter sp. R3-3]